MNENNKYYAVSNNLLTNKEGNEIVLAASGFDYTNFEIASNITTIKEAAFSGVEKLYEIVIPENVKYVESRAFENCKNLKSVTLSSSECEIGSYAFNNCSNLATVNNIELVKDFNDYVFANTSLVSLDLNNVNIKEGAFSGINTLTSVSVKANELESYAFNNCSNLTSLTLDCAEIGAYAFAGCKAVKDLYIEDSEHPLPFDNLNFFDGYSGAEASIETLYLGRDLYSSSQYEEKLSLPKSLKSLTISDGVTRLDNYRFNNRNLESIIVTEGNKYYDSRKECNAIIETSSNKLLFGCKNSTIPYGVATIGEEAFESSYGLKNIGIPGSVITIEDYAFAECLDLENIVISNSVTKLGEAVFVECESLKLVTVSKRFLWELSTTVMHSKAYIL